MIVLACGEIYLLNENRAALVNLWMEQAQKSLETAFLSLSAGAYSDAANRSYNCIFHSMRAMLASDGFDSKQHTSVILEFKRRYILKGVIEASFSKPIEEAFEARNTGGDKPKNISEEKVRNQTESAKSLFFAVENYIKGL